MSGFEVAGLVLGAVPLLIAALEGYQKLGKKRDAFTRRSIHVGKMIRSLRAQHTLIQGDVEIVLRNANVNAEYLEHLAYITLDSILSRDEVKNEVEVFLGSHYVSYKQGLEDCQRVLLELACRISAFRQGSWIAQKSLTLLLHENQHLTATTAEFWKRVQFSMKKAEMDRAIEELDQATFRLQRLSQQSLQLQQINIASASSKPKTRASLLRKVQRKAAMLHQALTRYWSTQCQLPHQTRLYLDTRLDEGGSAQVRTLLPKTISRNVAFRITLEGEGSNAHSFLYTCDVHAVEDEHTTKSNIVRFNLPSQSTATPAISVDDVCQLVHSFSANSDVLKLLLDESANLSYCSQPRRQHHALGASWPRQPSMISLQDVLHTNSVIFSRKLRVKMAALVASSVLQLHATPWAAALRESAIFFVRDDGGNVELHSPFIACRFDDRGPPAKTHAAQGEADLLELGIIIMALWERETLETYALRQGLIVSDEYDKRQSLARRWLADLEDEFVTSLYEAALRCVNCRFDATSIDLSNAKLNQDVFELVVKPLWDSCGH